MSSANTVGCVDSNARMQFNSNSDFPASHLPPEQWHTVASPPPDFDAAQFIPCACLTVRVLMRVTNNSSSSDNDANQPFDLDNGDHHQQQQTTHVLTTPDGQTYSIMTAKSVLVQTLQENTIINNGNDKSANRQQQTNNNNMSIWSDSSDDESSSDDDDDDDDDLMTDDDGNHNEKQSHPQYNIHHVNNNNTTNTTNNNRIERAYWLRGTLRQAIYGHVRYGIILHKLNPPIRILLPSTGEYTTVEWEATNESVAVKEMSWEHIKYQRSRLVEDPVKEVAAMQYLKRWMENQQQQQQQKQQQQQTQNGNKTSVELKTQFGDLNVSSSSSLRSNGAAISAHNIPPSTSPSASPSIQQPLLLPSKNNIHTSSPYQIPENMLESHVMMPLDLFTDHRNMYSIMPYCSGGELFDALERKNRFTELEARYWMRQILRGLAFLKNAGVAHRDLSLENLLVHNRSLLLIDMGMCLRVPLVDDNNNPGQNQQQQHNKTLRHLITPQGACGKWHYMSPEICKNKQPFDGHAVDLWAAGVILFLMLTGFPPWERAALSDERFKYMSNGYLVQMLTEWNVGLSADAMDLLQRMFWLDPLDRLSLEQVWNHPWMRATNV